MNLFTKLATLNRKYKILIMLLSDMIIVPFALWSAIALRLGTTTPYINHIWWVFIALTVLTIPVFMRIGLYRAVVRYFDEKVIYTVAFGVSLSTLILTLLIFMTQTWGIPRSSIIIYWAICMTYISTSRYLARGILRKFERQSKYREKVAIYGAGRAGLQVALSMISSPEYKPELFFDDSKDLQGSVLAGVKVYNPENALEILEQHNCREVLFAIPSATLQQRRAIIERFESKGLKLKIIPGLKEIYDGQISLETVREVSVEDLLGRDPVPANEALISHIIKDKVILVTGGGGSIGSEICRQALMRSPKKLIIFELNEFSLYKIDKECKDHFKNVEIISVLGNILNTNELKKIISDHAVDSVYHAAAYKHVPLVEDNIVSGINNNIFGTLSVLEAIKNSQVKNFTLISTDKAVRPTNVMGTTKRIAEMCTQSFSEAHPQIICSMVRFGNVLASSGSVIPLFKEQIKNGGPVTVTHPDINRYFMTIPEACELVLQAASMAQGGDLFVLDMGKPVKIVDLAKKMIELSGLTVKDNFNPNGDIEIKFVGLRPGEKLYEELLIGENVTPTLHSRIMRAREDFLEASVLKVKLQSLHEKCSKGSSLDALNDLKDIVKEFDHQIH